jgi:hypothetical protein
MFRNVTQLNLSASNQAMPIVRVNAAIIFFSAISLSGCAVQPWERGTLAKPQMAIDPHPAQTGFRGHNYLSREAAGGGGSTSGGGCGCY